MEVANVTYEEINPALRQLITDLFDEMYMDFGSAFTQKWGGVDPEKLLNHWCIQLSGFTPREIKRGIDEQKTLEKPPDIRQFKKLCRPGLDTTVAYYEAIAGIEERKKGNFGTWTHPAIYWATVAISYDLATLPFSVMKSRWEAALTTQMGKGQWDEIPKPMKALPNCKGMSKDKAAEFLKQIGVITNKATKGLDWANKLMFRAGNGDNTVSDLQIKFAREAIKNGAIA